jgi:haloalkane dehalogenase
VRGLPASIRVLGKASFHDTLQHESRQRSHGRHGRVCGHNGRNQARLAHREAIRGVAYMGALVQPRGWNDWPESTRGLLQAARSPAADAMALEQPFFEQALTSGILRTLSEEELAEYRRPFANPGEDRRPTLSWARENPLDGDPADVTKIENSYSEWLVQSSVPKLFVNAAPGTMTGSLLDFVRTWNAQREVTVRGLHFMVEDSPHEIGRAIADLLASIDADGSVKER